MIRTALRILLASAFATSGAVFAQAPERIVFATDWLAQAEHGGFYQALAEGTYRKYGLDVTIKMGGPQVNGLQLLAAGQLDVVMGDALQVVSAVEQGVPLVAIAATFQKNPTAIIAHPGVAKLEDLKGKPIAIGAASNTTFWPWLKQRYGFTDDQKRPYGFSRAAVPRRPDAVAAGLRHVRAVLDREGRRQAGRVPARRPRAIRRTPRRSSSRAPRSTGARDALARFVRASAEGWKSYLANPAPGNALIKRDNPEMSRRSARLQPSQDEGIRDRRRRRRGDAGPADDDRRALGPHDRLPARRGADQARHRLRARRIRSAIVEGRQESCPDALPWPAPTHPWSRSRGARKTLRDRARRRSRRSTSRCAAASSSRCSGPRAAARRRCST